MRKSVILSFLLSLLLQAGLNAQIADSTEVYLLTCAPGTESYSIYGHTALRIVIKGQNFDRVYNWGIFDFSTPNFVFRFAKGRLDYMLGAYYYDEFVNEYRREERSVWSQKVNLTSENKLRMFSLINDNLRPENIKYRYDFFFDNCATRVRDIIDNAVSDTIIWPEKEKKSTFRQLINPYQMVLPWLDFGADLLLGLQADKKASVADEMFLPLFLKENISNGIVIRNGQSEPILGPPVTIVEYSAKPTSRLLQMMPQIVFYLILIFVVLLTFVLNNRFISRVIDLIIYSVYSILALLLIFTNFFSEHDALHFNLMLLAVNPLIPVLLPYIIMGRKAFRLHRIALAVTILYFPAALIAGQGINPALIPLVLILAVRLFRHCEFGRSI